MDNVHELTSQITERYKKHSSSAAFTVAISGIDASGKGYIAGLLKEELESLGYKTAGINIDPWQHPLGVRLRNIDTAENFYDNAFRWDDLFEQLIIPLQKNKSIHLSTQGLYTHADEYYPLNYNFKDIDILLIEGIFLFKKQYLSYYDHRIWIDCSFKTGLGRALKRNAERLDEEKLRHDYHSCYYSAQRLHIERDDPRRTADTVFNNETDSFNQTAALQ